MTDRLYYDDAYLLSFDAVVTKTREENGKHLAAFDRSAFYPTSGGQPFDKGTVNGIEVLDVFVDNDGEVWHELAQPLKENESVHGEIDRIRRFDHMQQHAADHMIAGALYETMHATTIGLHIGDTFSSIDVQFEDGKTRLDEKTIEMIEDMVNERVQADGPIRCWFPKADELKQLPLRKVPTVKEHIRIVAIGDYEMVACGGTHPARTGEIGVIKILEVTPARGKARVAFVAGSRAFADYRNCSKSAHSAARLLTTGIDNLSTAVKNLQEQRTETERQLRTMRKEALIQSLKSEIEDAENINGVRLFVKVFDDAADLIKDAASEIIRTPKTAALIAASNGSAFNLVFARSADVDLNMGQLMRQAGARGGGKPDFAQGSGTEANLTAAREAVLSALSRA